MTLTANEGKGKFMLHGNIFAPKTVTQFLLLVPFLCEVSRSKLVTRSIANVSRDELQITIRSEKSHE